LPTHALLTPYLTSNKIWIVADTTIGDFGTTVSERIYRYSVP
jgi:hypothetical protein